MNDIPTLVYHVSYIRNAGWPTGRESYGHGVPMVVDGVTSIQGERESRSQGEVAQVDEMCGTPRRNRNDASGGEHTPGRGFVRISDTSSLLESRMP